MSGGGGSKIPSSIDTVASNANADLVNQQWMDYQTRFKPQEEKVINQVGGPGLQTGFLPAALAQAGASANAAHDSATGQRTRDLTRYGQAMTAEQKQQDVTQQGLGRAMSLADAANTTIRSDQNRKNEIMSGGLGAAATVGQ